MPFTPFHFGLGAFLKAGFRRRFSFRVFVFSQIFIDSEVLYHALRGDPWIHRYFHTYAGLLAVVPACLFVGRPLCVAASAFFKRAGVWRRQAEISFEAALWAGVLGSLTHVFFDGMMHRDMRPLWPFSAATPTLGWMSEGEVQLLFVFLAVFAVGVFLRRPKSGGEA